MLKPPRGRFDAYLRMHYLNDRMGLPARFAMGVGAIFMVHHVRPAGSGWLPPGAVAETDPLLVEEMVTLVAAQGLDVVSLDEARRRLLEGDFARRFVCFTFDGAYRNIADSVYPVFRRRGMPFALFVASDFIDGRDLPWWLALEALVGAADRLSPTIDGRRITAFCATETEKRQAAEALFLALRPVESGIRTQAVAALCDRHGLDSAALAQRAMLDAGTLRMLSRDSLVTIGTLGGGVYALAELTYDRAREEIERSVQAIHQAVGVLPRHCSYPGGTPAGAGRRDFQIAAALGMDMAVTAVEGALWPEHRLELCALPRIALDNDPATLTRALMLGTRSTAELRRRVNRSSVG